MLCKKYPQNGLQIQEKQKEALDNWERLEDLADARKIKLQDSYQLHKFLADSKEQVMKQFLSKFKISEKYIN